MLIQRRYSLEAPAILEVRPIARLNESALSQFIVFCLVGVINTAVDISIYYLLTRSVWSPEFITVSKIISYLAATLGSFVINRYWTFGKRDAVRAIEVVRFYSTVGLGIFINAGVHIAAVQLFGVQDLVAALCAAAGTALWGFIFAKFYVFK